MNSAELRDAILDVTARAAELRETFTAEVDARRAAAAGERLVSGGTEGLLSAVPLAARRSRRRVGRWLADGESTRFAGRVLLDAGGRPLLHERVDDGYVLTLWRYDGERVEEVRHWGSEPHVAWVLPAFGAVGADLSDRWAERWTWDGGHVVRVDRGRAAPGGWPHASATQAELDDRGALRALRDGIERSDIREDNRLDDDAWLDALEAALERAARVTCDNLNWIAARDAPATLRADLTGLAAWLGDAIADAIAAAAADSALPAPFCVLVSPGGDDQPLLPPIGLLADDRWRTGVTAYSPNDRDAIDHLWQGVDSGAVVALDITARLDDAALRACAEIGQALDLYADPAETARAAPVYGELADRIVARLAEPGRLRGATDEFLGLVPFGDRYADDAIGASLQRARRVLGGARVKRFTKTLRSRAPARDGVSAEIAARALRDRDALEQLLAALGLTARASELAHDVAEIGLLVRGEGERDGGSRLGGPAVLPAGVDWPLGSDERPLSFLAAVDLAELPPGGGRPSAGWWLFFAEYGGDEDGWLLFEPEDNVPGARARLLTVAPGETPVQPPEPLGERLRHRPVTFEPVLTLPNGYDAPAALGLDAFETHAYEAALQALWEALGEPTWMGGQHWVGGHVTGVQGHPPEPGTVLLLHLADDDSLGFNFLDAGTLQFRIGAEALERGDYSAVEADPSSC